MKTKLIFVLIISGIFVTGWMELHARAKNEYNRSISRIWKKKEYKRGIKILEKAVAEYPSEASFHANLINLYIKTKKYKKAYRIGRKAYDRFSDDRSISEAYMYALQNYGWDLHRRGNQKDMWKVFKLCYRLFPRDQYSINNFGFALREKKKYQKSINLLETGIKRFPKNKHIKNNLSWSYYMLGDKFFQGGKHKRAYTYFSKAYKIGDKNDINVYTAFLYKLPRLNYHREAELVLRKARKKFGNSPKLYRPTFWIMFSAASYYKKKKNLKKMVEYLKRLFIFSKTRHEIWEKGISFEDLALNTANNSIYSAIQDLCPYWMRLTASQRRKAYSFLRQFEKKLPSSLGFIALRLKGQILYRDGRVKEAWKTLNKSYYRLIRSPYGAGLKKTIVVPFPLRGIYTAGHNESRRYVTHMGLNRYCYDIYGSDKNGRLYRPGTKGRRLKDYYNFGTPVYSPVAGRVLKAVDNNPDDPPGPTPTGKKCNIVQIEKGNNIFLFVHLKQGSLRVKKGQFVRRGQVLASLGNSSSSLPHLHFCVYPKNWRSTLPLRFSRYFKVGGNKRIMMRRGQPGGKGGRDIIEAVP